MPPNDRTTRDEALDKLNDYAAGFFTVKSAIQAAKDAAYEGDDAIRGLGDRLLNSYKSAMEMRIGLQKQFAILSEEDGRDLVKKITDQDKFLRQNEINVKKFAENFNKIGQSLQTYVIERSDQSIINFAKFISLNEKIGIGVDNSTKLINYLGAGFGKSSKDVEEFSNKLITFAKVTGQDVNKVFQDFTAATKNFSTILSPEQAASQFMAFQQLARGFGTTIDSLVTTAKKFDDIQQGVDFGAQLNNVLSAVGGSFDSVFATTLDYESRIKYIMKSIAETRGQIDRMSDVSQRAFITQLQMSSGLSNEVVTSLLRNGELVKDIEQMSTGAGKFENLKETKITDRIAEGFTTFQDRANLFLNVWNQFGARAEALFSAQTKFQADIQFKLLEGISKGVKTASSAKDLEKIVAEQMKNMAEEIGKMYKAGTIDENSKLKRFYQESKDTFSFVADEAFKKSKSQVLAKVLPASGKGQVIDLGDGLQVRHVEALEKLAKEMEEKRNKPPKEYKTSVTLYGDEVLLALVKQFKQQGGSKTNIGGPAVKGIGN